MTTIVDLVAHDVRFPTSELLDGSDAMNPDPDYSAAYVELRTEPLPRNASGKLLKNVLRGEGEVSFAETM